MKKIIITIMAILSVITLASCNGKTNVNHELYSSEIGEMKISEKTIEEETIEETFIYTDIEFEGKIFTNVKMTKSEMDNLMNGYEDGLFSKEYVEEVLFNAQS